MTPLVKAAHERIDAATAGRGLSGYSCVAAGDVATLAAAVKPDKQDGVVLALLKGAAANPPGVEIWQRTEHLRHLLDCVK